MELREIGEFGLIAEIAGDLGDKDGELVVGIGDDAAVIKSRPDLYTVVSSDAFVEDVHFRLEYFSFFDLGWRLAAANLSDISAMGGRPKHLLVNLALPRGTTVEQVKELYRGLRAIAEKFAVTVVGGDTVSSPGKLFLSATVLGEVAPNDLKLRSGAKPEEGIFITGFPGLAQVGLSVLTKSAPRRSFYVQSVARHLRPVPRVSEVRHLLKKFTTVGAMIDISDGLASELHHFCRQSGVGALIDENGIPLHPELTAASAEFGGSALQFALTGGEDFEILFTAAPGDKLAMQTSLQESFGLPLSQIGITTNQPGEIHIRNNQGDLVVLPNTGFDHFADPND